MEIAMGNIDRMVCKFRVGSVIKGIAFNGAFLKFGPHERPVIVLNVDFDKQVVNIESLNLSTDGDLADTGRYLIDADNVKRCIEAFILA